MIRQFPFVGEIAKPAEPVNGKMNGAYCAAVDSPARLCWQAIKRRTARSAAAPRYSLYRLELKRTSGLFKCVRA